MNILVCGTCIPPEFEKEVTDLSAAGNQYQVNLIKSLKKIANVKAISFINIDVNGYEDQIKQKQNEYNMECILAKGNILKAYKIYRKKIKSNKKWADIVISYNVLYPWFGINKWYKDKKTIGILADYTPAIEEKGIKKIHAILASYYIKKYNKLVLLSSSMKKHTIKKQDVVVINGCIDTDKFREIKPTNNNDGIINIVYTGLISKVTGVDLLVRAFKKLPGDNLRLIISGKGDELSDYIKEASECDNRIIFKGFVDRNEYYNILKSSNILVNPRNMNYMQNANNFPSKVLEYLATGRYIISTKFSGYKDFENNIKFVDSNEISITEGLKCIINTYSENKDQVYTQNREFSKLFEWENQISKYL